jgi:hypothetical protein
MGDWIRIAVWALASGLRSRRNLALENVALRQQLMVLQRQKGTVSLKDRDRLFWIWLRRVWPSWRRALVLVQPATVVGWHRRGFRAYWRWKSRPKGGRPRIDPDGILATHTQRWSMTMGTYPTSRPAGGDTSWPGSMEARLPPDGAAREKPTVPCRCTDSTQAWRASRASWLM